MKLFLAAACLAVLLAGCGDESPGEGAGNDTGPNGEVLLVGEYSRNGDDALIGGDLAMAGDCLGLENRGQVDLVVWPAGTTFQDGDELGVVLPDGRTLHLGDPFSGGGGYSSPGEGDRIPTIPDGCPDFGEVAVLNSDQSP